MCFILDLVERIRGYLRLDSWADAKFVALNTYFWPKMVGFLTMVIKSIGNYGKNGQNLKDEVK